jgi:hypothetical protein
MQGAKNTLAEDLKARTRAIHTEVTAGRSVTPDDIESLLRLSGARQPWQEPNQCGPGAARINVLRSSLSTREKLAERSVYDRAQDAIDELRRCLPEIMAWAIVLSELSIPVNGQEKSDARYLSDLLRLSDALVDITPKVLRERIRHIAGNWHSDAASLSEVYRAIVGANAAISKSGPGCRFIQAALFVIHGKEYALGTIDEAVRRLCTIIERTTTNP